MYLFELKPTSRCSGACWFCSDKPNICKEITTKQWINKFNLIHGELSNKKLIEEYFISGGEPTYYPKRLKEVINVILSKKDFGVSMVTNGFRLNECLPFLKGRLKALFISRHNHIDGGIKNAPTNKELKEIISKIQIKDVAINCALQTTTDLVKMIELAKYIGANRVNFLQLSGVHTKNTVRFSRAIKKLGIKPLEKHGLYYCKCEVAMFDEIEIRFKHASLPRILNSKKDIANQFTLHPDGCLTSGWSRNSKIVLA